MAANRGGEGLAAFGGGTPVLTALRSSNGMMSGSWCLSLPFLFPFLMRMPFSDILLAASATRLFSAVAFLLLNIQPRTTAHSAAIRSAMNDSLDMLTKAHAKAANARNPGNR